MSPCVEWTGAVNSAGYGPHRKVYEQAYGPIEGLHAVVKHSCDNKLCINLDHLEVGSQSSNVKDAFKRGRVPSDRRKKLPLPVMREIKQALLGGVSLLEMAARTGITHSYLCKIRLGKAWAHVQV